MLKLNTNQLVKVSVMGEVASSVYREIYQVSHKGEALNLPTVGGIVYNIKVGDLVRGWIGDHIEPGVSTMNTEGKEGRYSQENAGYNILSCIGNEAKVISGKAKGAKGAVTGIHGGIEHVLIDFDNKTLEKLAHGDKIQVKAFGLGLAIVNHPEIKFFNLDPNLLKKINPQFDKQGNLVVPVIAKIPPYLMGSGLGQRSVASGDYDITMADDNTIKKLGLDKLRFGDIVAIEDTDNSFGRCYKPGAVSVGVIVHSDCVLAGHGPGVVTIITSSKGKIKPKISKNANIGYYLKIGRFRKR